MLVKELKELLAKFDDDAEVELDGGYADDGCDYAQLSVDDEVVWEQYRGV